MNCLKPSSSGRTAQLLASSGSVAPQGFVGFALLSSNDNNEDEELSLEPDFRVVLKKMVKKDCVTKVKVILFQSIH
jgi:hypothetical protein